MVNIVTPAPAQPQTRAQPCIDQACQRSAFMMPARSAMKPRNTVSGLTPSALHSSTNSGGKSRGAHRQRPLRAGVAREVQEGYASPSFAFIAAMMSSSV